MVRGTREEKKERKTGTVRTDPVAKLVEEFRNRHLGQTSIARVHLGLNDFFLPQIRIRNIELLTLK